MGWGKPGGLSSVALGPNPSGDCCWISKWDVRVGKHFWCEGSGWSGDAKSVLDSISCRGEKYSSLANASTISRFFTHVMRFLQFNAAAMVAPSRSIPAIPSALFPISCMGQPTSYPRPSTHCSSVQKLRHPTVRRRIKTPASDCAPLNPGPIALTPGSRILHCPGISPIVFSDTVFDRRTEVKLWSQC
jgi:hypothetical protein